MRQNADDTNKKVGHGEVPQEPVGDGPKLLAAQNRNDDEQVSCKNNR